MAARPVPAHQPVRRRNRVVRRFLRRTRVAEELAQHRLLLREVDKPHSAGAAVLAGGAAARFPAPHDQKVFDDVKLGVRIAFLDTVFFATFCASRGGVYTVHANCCIGQENKGPRAGNVIAAWKNYTSLAPLEKESGKAGGRTPAGAGRRASPNRYRRR